MEFHSLRARRVFTVALELQQFHISDPTQNHPKCQNFTPSVKIVITLKLDHTN